MARLKDIWKRHIGKITNATPFIAVLILVFMFSPIFLSKSTSKISPHQIVALFDETYGSSEMSDIVPYTTGRFRGDKPRELWVIDTWKTLKGIKYKRLSSEFIESRIEGDKAVVVLESEYLSVGGNATQKEVFYLIKEHGIWRIDELVVADEEVEARKEPV